MAYTHTLPTNNYGPAKIIVATSAANGTHTTLAGAMADAVSGDTIFLRDSVTEDLTLTAGVNIAAWTGETLNTPTITGKLSMTTAGTCNISGIRLASNGAEFLSVTGSAASIVNLNNCYLTTAFDPGITFSSSSASAEINIFYCQGNISASAKKFFSHSSAGTLQIQHSFFTNSGLSTSISNCSAGVLLIYFSKIFFAVGTSSTGSSSINQTIIDCGAINTTCITANGSGPQTIQGCILFGGTASSLSVGGSANVSECTLDSSNTNVITGAGTIDYAGLTFSGSSFGMNTTTQTVNRMQLGSYSAKGQPCFNAYLNTGVNNVTGDGTTYTVIFDATNFDQTTNFNTGTGTFTAPIAGRYFFTATIEASAIIVSSVVLTLVTTGGSYRGNRIDNSTGTNDSFTVTAVVNMTANDTATITFQAAGGAKNVGILGKSGSNFLTYFNGYQVA